MNARGLQQYQHHNPKRPVVPHAQRWRRERALQIRRARVQPQGSSRRPQLQAVAELAMHAEMVCLVVRDIFRNVFKQLSYPWLGSAQLQG